MPQKHRFKYLNDSCGMRNLKARLTNRTMTRLCLGKDADLMTEIRKDAANN